MLRTELRTNSHGYLPRKQPKLADSLPDAFPNQNVLRAYVQPVTTESEARLAGGSPPMPQVAWHHEHSLPALAQFCEEKFEWGTMQTIPERFRRLLWRASVIRMLRRAMLDLDHDCGEGTCHVISPEKESRKELCAGATPRRQDTCRTAIGIPSETITKHFASLHSPASLPSDDTDVNEEHPLISNITASTTTHSTTDFLAEYRVRLDPYQLVRLTQAGIEGNRDEPVKASDGSADNVSADSRKAADPFSLFRIWVPACMLRPVEQDLVNAYEAEQETKHAKRRCKPERHAMALDISTKTALTLTTSLPTKRLWQQAFTDSEEHLESASRAHISFKPPQTFKSQVGPVIDLCGDDSQDEDITEEHPESTSRAHTSPQTFIGPVIDLCGNDSQDEDITSEERPESASQAHASFKPPQTFRSQVGPVIDLCGNDSQDEDMTC